MTKIRIIYNVVLMAVIFLTSFSTHLVLEGSNESSTHIESSNLDEVTIGKQVWSTKNLDVDNFRNGDPIPQAKTKEQWDAAVKNKQPAWCYYDNDTANGAKYGKLYNWFAVSDSRILAPNGYHIPTNAEWTILEKYLGDSAGKKIKSAYSWRDNSDNSSGFSGLPGGIRFGSGTFIGIGDAGIWWSSSEFEYNTVDAWYLAVASFIDGVDRDRDLGKEVGMSVRCLRD
jgi:uncharacterized protein (TIGR02145 family)